MWGGDLFFIILNGSEFDTKMGRGSFFYNTEWHRIWHQNDYFDLIIKWQETCSWTFGYFGTLKDWNKPSSLSMGIKAERFTKFQGILTCFQYKFHIDITTWPNLTRFNPKYHPKITSQNIVPENMNKSISKNNFLKKWSFFYPNTTKVGYVGSRLGGD